MSSQGILFPFVEQRTTTPAKKMIVETQRSAHDFSVVLGFDLPSQPFDGLHGRVGKDQTLLSPLGHRSSPVAQAVTEKFGQRTKQRSVRDD